MTRKLASVRVISELRPIDGADRIELAIIDGWQVVVKKGEFDVKDKCIYFEIDSWIPHSLAPFLSKEKEPKAFNNIPGNRLRTIRLRKQLSQGLILPLDDYTDMCATVGDDLTETLNIQLYEKPLPAQLAGRAKGNFPAFIFKTDQERIQNIPREVEGYNRRKEVFEVTEKLDGSSMTVYMKDGVFGVCSRNLDLQIDQEGNTFIDTARKLNLAHKLLPFSEVGTNIALQGELVGPGIQGNQYGFSEHFYFIFDIFDINQQVYLSPENRQQLCQQMDLPHVPFIGDFEFEGENVGDILEMAKGKSVLNDSTREGIVFKSYANPTHHFKSINNDWLLTEKE